MMIKLIATLTFLLGAACSQAQVLQPVKWSFSAKKIADSTYEVRLSATVAPAWAIYAMDTPEGGPIPTAVRFQPNPMILLQGDIRQAGTLRKKQDPTFGVGVHYFMDKADFVQVVRLRSPVKTVLSGTVEYMACDQERCLPPETVPFTITVP